MATAQSTLNSAIAAGYDRLSTRDVMLCILQGAQAGGGGGGGTPNLIQNFGGVAPVAPGVAIGQAAFDTSSGKEWVWDGATWIPFIS